MRKIFCQLFFALILILGIGGCRQAGPLSAVQSEAPSAVQSETPSAAALPSPIPSKTAPPPAPTVYVVSTLENFHNAIATDELLNKYASYHEYSSDELARIVIWTDTVVKDFAFMSVTYDDTGDKFTFSEGDILYSLDELTPQKPFVADIFSPELFPVNGITFLDENGVKRYFAIQADGRGAEEAPPYFFLEFQNGGPLFPVIVSQ